MDSSILRKDFLEAVEKKDKGAIKNYITQRITEDKGFRTGAVEQCMEYLMENGLDIKEEYVIQPGEEGPFPDDIKELFNFKVRWLKQNFAYDKRIGDIKRIGRELESRKTAGFSPAPQGHRSQIKKVSPLAIVGVIVLIAAVIGTIIALLRK